MSCLNTNEVEKDVDIILQVTPPDGEVVSHVDEAGGRIDH